MSEKCVSCKYWGNEGRIDDDIVVGECRRRPPKLNVKEMNKFDSLDTPEEARWMATFFPMTSQNTWCGKWMAR